MTPSTAYTQDCLSSLHLHDYKLTPEFSFSFRSASLHDRLPLASAPWELQGKVALSQSHGCELTNWWQESQHPARRPWTASQFSSKLVQSRPLSSHNHSLQVHLHTRSITILECISMFTRSMPPTVSPNTLDYGLQVHLQTSSITDSVLARSRPRSVSATLLYHSLQLHLQTRSVTVSKLARSQPPSVSPSLLNFGLRVHLQTPSVTVSKLAWSRPPCVSPNSLDDGLQVHLHTGLITILECLTKCTWSWSPSVSPNTLDYCLQVHLQTRLIMALECMSEFSRSTFSGAPRIALKHYLQPVQIYGV